MSTEQITDPGPPSEKEVIIKLATAAGDGAANVGKAVAVGASGFWGWLCRRNWRLIAFMAVLLPPMGLGYWVINSRGFAIQFDALAMKLYKVPFLAGLGNYAETRNLTVAHPIAMAVMIGVYFVTVLLVGTALRGVEHVDGMEDERHRRFIFCFGVVALLGDTWFFYKGVSDGSFFEAGFSLSAVVVSIFYTGVLVMLGYFHVRLSHKGT